MGSTLISGGTDFSIIVLLAFFFSHPKLWNLQTGEPITSLKGHCDVVSSLCVYQNHYLISTDLSSLVMVQSMNQIENRSGIWRTNIEFSTNWRFTAPKCTIRWSLKTDYSPARRTDPSWFGLAARLHSRNGQRCSISRLSRHCSRNAWSRRRKRTMWMNICRSRRVSKRNWMNRRGIHGAARRKANATRREIDDRPGLIGFWSIIA